MFARGNSFNFVPTPDPLVEEEFFSPALRETVQAVNQRIEAIEVESREIVASRQVMLDAKARTFDPDDSLDMRSRFVALVKSELEVRDEIGEVIAAIRQEIEQESEKARSEVVEIEAKLVKALEKIGYAHFDPAVGPVVGSWIPDFINRHPLVRQARVKAESLHLRLTSRDSAIANQKCIENLERILVRLREQALAIT
jgi:hypothetical protein